MIAAIMDHMSLGIVIVLILYGFCAYMAGKHSVVDYAESSGEEHRREVYDDEDTPAQTIGKIL